MKKWLLPCLALCLAACTPSKIEDVINAERQKVARDYIARLIAGDITGLINEVEPALNKPDTPRVFSEMRALLPPGAPTSVELVGFGGNRQAKELTCTLNFQYGYRDNKWYLVSVSWREKLGKPREITGLAVTKLVRSLEETNAFTFAHARPRHYAFMAALIVVPAFILVSLVTCLRMKRLPTKWIWVILIVMGVGRFSLNWTSGLLLIVPVSVQFLGVSASAGAAYAPWLVSVSCPIGAGLFWIRRWQLRRADAKAGRQP